MGDDIEIFIAYSVCAVAMLLWLLLTYLYFGPAYKLAAKDKTPASPNTATEVDAETIRVKIRHENELINHRLTWLLTLEGLLLAGIGFAWDKQPSNSLVFFFSIIGIVTAGAAMIVLDGAHHAIMRQSNWWDDHRPINYAGVELLGFKGHHPLLGLFAPWRLIPPLFICGWLFLFQLKTQTEDLPPLQVGKYQFVRIETANAQNWGVVLNTATGEIEKELVTVFRPPLGTAPASISMEEGNVLPNASRGAITSHRPAH